MIRVCDQCGGRGEVPMVEDGQGDFLVSCPRCEGMPKLRGVDFRQWVWNTYPGGAEPDWYKDLRSHRYPDPDTVIQWCAEHASVSIVHPAPTRSTKCEHALRTYMHKLGWPTEPCRLSWIEVPTRLEEAT